VDRRANQTIYEYAECSRAVRSNADYAKNEFEELGSLAQVHENLKREILECCFSDFGPEVGDKLIACFAYMRKRLGYDFEDSNSKTFANVGWLRDLILTAADESKANGMLSDDDARIIDMYREDFDRYSSHSTDQANAFFSSSSPTLKLQRGTVQGLEFMVIGAIEAAFIIGATAEISESAKHSLKTKQAELARRAWAKKPRKRRSAAPLSQSGQADGLRNRRKKPRRSLMG
jgi:hypothetical protein